jgi:hypothetical protein
MKKLILSFIMFIAIFSNKLEAQSISSSQLYADSTISHLSIGGGRMGWVKRTGSYYSHYYMDTMQNVTSFADTNLAAGSLNIGSGNYLCASTVDQNGNLIGLFYDYDCLHDSVINGTTMLFNFSCYFWYDFASQQKIYISFSPEPINNWWYPSDQSNVESTYKVIWSADTLILLVKKQEITSTSLMDNKFMCIKFLNLNLVEGGTADSYGGNIRNCFIDYNNKINTLYDNEWIISDGANYTIYQPAPGITGYTDGVTDNSGNTYIKYGNFYDSLLIKNNSSETRIAAPQLVFTNRGALCIDHANRLWLASQDSVYLYTNNTWYPFKINFNNYANTSTFLRSYRTTFFEYAKNKFVLSCANDIEQASNAGNGLIFFTFNDTNTMTNNIALKRNTELRTYPNPASTIVTIDQLPNSGKLAIKDVLGNEVFSSNITNPKMVVDVSKLSNGIYFVNINNNHVKKMVIQK